MRGEVEQVGIRLLTQGDAHNSAGSLTTQRRQPAGLDMPKSGFSRCGKLGAT